MEVGSASGSWGRSGSQSSRDLDGAAKEAARTGRILRAVTSGVDMIPSGCGAHKMKGKGEGPFLSFDGHARAPHSLECLWLLAIRTSSNT